MKFIETKIPDVYIIEPSVFNDKRGYFVESFNLKKFQEKILPINFIQDNESKSTRGVLRGLHFQIPPFDQAKLVRCISGNVIDVAVDIRKGSPTYGKHISIKLSGENKKQLFIPKGFAHGFLVLSQTAIFGYKVDNLYSSEHDTGIIYDDMNLGIDWLLNKDEIKLSKKDKNLKSFNALISPFKYNRK